MTEDLGNGLQYPVPHMNLVVGGYDLQEKGFWRSLITPLERVLIKFREQLFFFHP